VYLYRAVDKAGQTAEFFLSHAAAGLRTGDAERSCFEKAPSCIKSAAISGRLNLRGQSAPILDPYSWLWCLPDTT
jgi:hypothetical protein